MSYLKKMLNIDWLNIKTFHSGKLFYSYFISTTFSN